MYLQTFCIHKFILMNIVFHREFLCRNFLKLGLSLTQTLLHTDFWLWKINLSDRETTVAVYGFATLGMLAFTLTLGLQSRVTVYVTSTLVGWVMINWHSSYTVGVKATLTSDAL
jgi:hypothetical protein